MELQEFSDQFDVLYNNITSNQAPGLDEYEKSVFLTKAQDEILKSYFDPKSNKVQEGFDGSQRRQIDFSMLIQVTNYSTVDNGYDWEEWDPGHALLDPRENSKSVVTPPDILMVLNERVLVTRRSKPNIPLTVVPIAYTEYDRLMSKPYKRPLKWQAWRIFNSTVANTSDLVVGPEDTITAYTIRYLKRPTPIMLSDLDGLTIDGLSGPRDCVLDPILHQEVLQRAVELAKAAYAGDLTTTIALGQSSETPMGYVSSK